MADNTDTRSKLPITPGALEARVRRALAAAHPRLRRRKSDGSLWLVAGSLATPVELEDLAREMNLLAPHETVAA